jgi:hypothetical protein
LAAFKFTAKLEFAGLTDREIAGYRAFQDLIDQICTASE